MAALSVGMTLLPVEMLIPLLTASAVNIAHGINILLTGLI